MVRNWVIFEGRPNRRDRDRARVTLNRKGIFLLNKAAFEELKRPEAVRLMFNPANQTIGLAATRLDRENAFPVKTKDKYSNRIVLAGPFCKHFGITVETTVLFNGITTDRDGVLILELSETTVIGRGGH
ncbi:hypothetical protein BH10ACI3_BH10ACI3_17490 [soil metagenome]